MQHNALNADATIICSQNKPSIISQLLPPGPNYTVIVKEPLQHWPVSVRFAPSSSKLSGSACKMLTSESFTCTLFIRCRQSFQTIGYHMLGGFLHSTFIWYFTLTTRHKTSTVIKNWSTSMDMFLTTYLIISFPKQQP
jgi:hypothetical protein